MERFGHAASRCTQATRYAGGVAIMTAARSDHNIPGSPMQKAGFQLESGFGSSIGEAAKTFFGR